MTKVALPLLFALAAGALASCQPTPATTSNSSPAEATALAPTPTEAAARAAVARHIQGLSNAALFVPDLARANDNHAS